jgi:glyoxylase I family protein
MPARSRPPLVVEGIDHLLLLVSGMPKAVAFYRDVLGCTVCGKLPEYAIVQLRAGNAFL